MENTIRNNHFTIHQIRNMRGWFVLSRTTLWWLESWVCFFSLWKIAKWNYAYIHYIVEVPNVLQQSYNPNFRGTIKHIWCHGGKFKMHVTLVCMKWGIRGSYKNCYLVHIIMQIGLTVIFIASFAIHVINY
mgnify:FL=1